MLFTWCVALPLVANNKIISGMSSLKQLGWLCIRTVVHFASLMFPGLLLAVQFITFCIASLVPRPSYHPVLGHLQFMHSLVPRPSHHPVLAYCKQSKPGWWEGLGMGRKVWEWARSGNRPGLAFALSEIRREQTVLILLISPLVPPMHASRQ